jgi:hypothetical protein
VLKKKIWANFQRIIELFAKKLSKSSSKYGLGIRDPGSEIRDPGSEIRDPDPQHCGLLLAYPAGWRHRDRKREKTLSYV